MSVGSRLAVLLALAVWLAAPASSGERTHEVSAGESASSVAKRFYGSYEPAEVLLLFNGKTDTVIHAGDKLRVPYCDLHRVQAGDTWSALSKRYVGRASAYRSIALLNGLSPDEPLQIGQLIVMPVAISYRLARGDTLASLAERFYGGPERARSIQVFNDIEDPRRLSTGQAIEIPLTTLRLRKKTAVAETADRPEPQRAASPAKITPSTSRPVSEPVRPVSEPAAPPAEPAPRFQSEIDRARHAFQQGEFDRAREMVESLRESVEAQGTLADQRELLHLQAFVYVAFDLPEQACDAYRSLVELSPSVRLNPQLVSPKIRSTLAACAASL